MQHAPSTVANSLRIPPQNLDAEQSVLGALLIDKEAIIKIADMITGEDFYKDAHRFVYESMVELFDRHDVIDILSVGNRLQEKKILERIGGRAYLVELTGAVPSASHIVQYAKIIKHKATLRRLMTAADRIGALAQTEDEDVEHVLDNAEQQLFAVSQKHLQQNFVPVHSILESAFERMDEIHQHKGSMRGVPTGFNDLDFLLGGLQKSDLVILAARPSVGKTSLAMDIARQAASVGKQSVGIFSLEMSKEQLVDRLISTEAAVSLWKMRTGNLSHDHDDFSKIGEAIARLSDMPLYIDDKASANVLEIRTKARRLKSEHGLGLIIIDYLQLMENRTSESRTQEIAEITRGLKALARELGVPVLALSQLSRAVEAQSGPAIPRLSHLRESGSIEQDADVVLFIYRKSADRAVTCSEEEKNMAEIHVAKHRNGPTGVVHLFFDADRVSFRNMSTKYTPQAIEE